MKLYIKSSKLSHDVNEYQEWIDYDMKHYGKISKKTMDDIKKAGFTVTKDQYGDYEVTAATKVEASELSHDFDEYQKWVDYDMKRYGRISAETRRKIRDAGFTVTRDQYGDYEVTASKDVECDTDYNTAWKDVNKKFLEVRTALNVSEFQPARRLAFKKPWRFYKEHTVDEAIEILKEEAGIDASEGIKADTVKKGNKWVNRGDTGEEHGEFDTKKEADQQRKAMYARGWKGGK